MAQSRVQNFKWSRQSNTADGAACGAADNPPHSIIRRGRTVRVPNKAHLQDQHSDVCMHATSSDGDEYYLRRQTCCRKRGRTLPILDLSPVPRGAQMLHGTAVHHIHGDDAHSIEHRRRLPTMGTRRGHVAVHTGRLEEITDVQAAGAGYIADGPPAVDRHGKRRCCARRPQEEVF